MFPALSSLFAVVRTPLLFGAALLSLSCKSLDRFDTSGDPAFCGTIVAGPSFHDGFIATNEPPTLRLKLDLETNQLSSSSDNKVAFLGWLTSSDGEAALCEERPLFDHSPIRSIPQVYHDSLSTLVFGEGHDEDFFAWVDSTCQGTMLALISLLRSGNVEVRLFKPAPLSDIEEGPNKRPGYALFFMSRDEKGCGFE